MEEPVRSHLIDYKYVLGLVLAGIAFYWTQRLDDDRRTSVIEGKQAIAPDMRNRELDDVKARIAALESYMIQGCGRR